MLNQILIGSMCYFVGIATTLVGCRELLSNLIDDCGLRGFQTKLVKITMKACRWGVLVSALLALLSGLGALCV
jgi:hypothetical protein